MKRFQVRYRHLRFKAVDDMLMFAIRIDSKQVAAELLTEYAKARELTIEKAKEDLGYRAGYMTELEAKKVWELFECTHPIFGTSWPDPDEALRLGKELGARWRRESEERERAGELHRTQEGEGGV